jgi:hypothetical protein
VLSVEGDFLSDIDVGNPIAVSKTEILIVLDMLCYAL